VLFACLQGLVVYNGIQESGDAGGGNGGTYGVYAYEDVCDEYVFVDTSS
jgi:hypothetical protein